MLRPLLALAVLAFPSEFRREYRAQLFLDLDHRGSERWYALRLFFDVVAGGVSMRLDLLRGDIVYAIRVLARGPLFTGIVAATLVVATGQMPLFSAYLKQCFCGRYRMLIPIDSFFSRLGPRPDRRQARQCGFR